MRTLLLTFALLLAGCGASTTGGKCTTACDCTDSSKPLDCATGEWTCSDKAVCTYACQPTCGSGGVGTCAYPAQCNTTAGFCSEHTTCT